MAPVPVKTPPERAPIAAEIPSGGFNGMMIVKVKIADNAQPIIANVYVYFIILI